MDWRVELGNGLWFDATPDYWNVTPSSIRKIEKEYNARYVTEWQTESQPIMLFWTDVVSKPEYSNWIGIYADSRMWYVCNGLSAASKPICCYTSNDGQLLFSKQQHDFRTSHDQSLSVDGGPKYTRILGDGCKNPKYWLLPRFGKLEIIPDTMAKLLLPS